MKDLIETVFTGVVIYFLYLLLSGGLESETNMMKSQIGTKRIIGKDTLMVVDYSLLRETFILSNGVEINKEYK